MYFRFNSAWHHTQSCIGCVITTLCVATAHSAQEGVLYTIEKYYTCCFLSVIQAQFFTAPYTNTSVSRTNNSRGGGGVLDSIYAILERGFYSFGSSKTELEKFLKKDKNYKDIFYLTMVIL